MRTVKRLKLLAHLHPPMLDVMAQGSMPSEDQLRTIAAASLEEQAQVWKKNKPKKGHEVSWYEVARALSKRRIPFAAAKFDDDLARAYGVVWEDDLFAPAGEDGRYTTNVEGFFGAQQEWLANNLPERGRCCRRTSTASPSCRRRPSASTASRARATSSATTSTALRRGEDHRLPDARRREAGEARQGRRPLRQRRRCGDPTARAARM